MSWLSAAIGAVGDLFATNQANAANAAALEKQMDFNKEVMQNRHQWEVQDLRAAGLNPLMSTTSPTGTLSAPNSAPAQKANFAQSAAALAQINIADKQAEAALNSSKADLHNAKTNEINANTAAVAQEQEQIKNQNDFRIASEQINIAMRDLDIRKRLADADISLKDQQKIYQEIQNNYAGDIAQAELDYKVQEIVLAAETAAASIELMRKQGRAADAAALESETKAYLNERIANLTDKQADELSFKLYTDQERWKGEKPKREREAYEQEAYNKWRRTPIGTITFGAGVILDDVFHNFSAGGRLGNTNFHTR